MGLHKKSKKMSMKKARKRVKPEVLKAVQKKNDPLNQGMTVGQSIWDTPANTLGARVNELQKSMTPDKMSGALQFGSTGFGALLSMAQMRAGGGGAAGNNMPGFTEIMNLQKTMAQSMETNQKAQMKIEHEKNKAQLLQMQTETKNLHKKLSEVKEEFETERIKRERIDEEHARDKAQKELEVHKKLATEEGKKENAEQIVKAKFEGAKMERKIGDVKQQIKLTDDIRTKEEELAVMQQVNAKLQEEYQKQKHNPEYLKKRQELSEIEVAIANERIKNQSLQDRSSRHVRLLNDYETKMQELEEQRMKNEVLEKTVHESEEELRNRAANVERKRLELQDRERIANLNENLRKSEIDNELTQARISANEQYELSDDYKKKLAELGERQAKLDMQKAEQERLEQNYKAFRDNVAEVTQLRGRIDFDEVKQALADPDNKKEADQLLAMDAESEPKEFIEKISDMTTRKYIRDYFQKEDIGEDSIFYDLHKRLNQPGVDEIEVTRKYMEDDPTSYGARGLVHYLNDEGLNAVFNSPFGKAHFEQLQKQYIRDFDLKPLAKMTVREDGGLDFEPTEVYAKPEYYGVIHNFMQYNQGQQTPHVRKAFADLVKDGGKNWVQAVNDFVTENGDSNEARFLYTELLNDESRKQIFTEDQIQEMDQYYNVDVPDYSEDGFYYNKSDYIPK